jgi:hypothetical protein
MMAKGFLPLLHAGDYVIITINSICAVARYGHFQSKKEKPTHSSHCVGESCP